MLTKTELGSVLQSQCYSFSPPETMHELRCKSSFHLFPSNTIGFRRISWKNAIAGSALQNMPLASSMQIVIQSPLASDSSALHSVGDEDVFSS